MLASTIGSATAAAVLLWLITCCSTFPTPSACCPRHCCSLAATPQPEQLLYQGDPGTVNPARPQSFVSARMCRALLLSAPCYCCNQHCAYCLRPLCCQYCLRPLCCHLLRPDLPVPLSLHHACCCVCFQLQLPPCISSTPCPLAGRPSLGTASPLRCCCAGCS